jgi:predicted Fe-Mo cluster-binding NifX family protein
MSYKIAMTSSDGSTIDLHFGETESFHILEVDEQSGRWELLGRRGIECSPSSCGESTAGENSSCGAEGGCGGGGHSDARVNAVVETLSDCKYVLTAKIGPKFHNNLQKAGITALESPRDIASAISKLNVYHRKYARVAEARLQ